MMEYKIISKEAFEVIGTSRKFCNESAFSEIPQFWSEHFQKGNGQFVAGMYGISYDQHFDSGMFDYMIADNAEGKGEMPDEFSVMEIPAKTWAVFPVKGLMPAALQEAIGKVWSEWLPNCSEYQLDGNVSIEVYSEGDMSSPDYYCELWIPVSENN